MYIKKQKMLPLCDEWRQEEIEIKRQKERAQSRKWSSGNPEKIKQASLEWNERNPDKILRHGREYYAANREICIERARAAYIKDPESRKAAVRKWYVAHKDYVASKCAQRHAQKLRATPLWARPELIASFYRMAEVFDLEVDHIVPLRGKTVCGLHVEHNLQLLTRKENIKKGNRLWENMP